MRMFSLDLGLQDTHVLVTGGAGFIGSVTVEAFIAAGAKVSCLDISATKLEQLSGRLADSGALCQRLYTHAADITDADALAAAFKVASQKFGPVECCVALAAMDLSALPHVNSIVEMDPAQFKRTQEVNIYGTFLTAQTWLRQLKADVRLSTAKNLSLIIVGSESGLFGERGNADYASSKSAVQGGLLQSLKADVPRLVPRARVNAIAPGPVDTPQFRKECKENEDQLWVDSQATVALGRPVDMDSVARSILYLASEKWSGSVHGHLLQVDSGKQGKLHWAKGEI